MFRKTASVLLWGLVLVASAWFVFESDTLSSVGADDLTYVVVDTGQDACYDLRGRKINDPADGSSLYGQDAQYDGVQPAYKDNGDGTITDLNTGLIWQKTPPYQTFHWDEALDYADDLVLGGKSDWRLPTIKELLSLVNFNGTQRTWTPYIDTDYFDYYQPADFGQNRDMDGQYWSSTASVAQTMRNDDSAFGFNFADGRIKAYPKTRLNGFVRCVRSNKNYGGNDFRDNGDGTVTDDATGLMWMQIDSGSTMNWEDALEYAENLKYAGYSDWRLPNAKELQSIVDYTRAPDHPNASRRSAAIDPIFDVTEDESWFWTGTTLLEDPSSAVYVAFGRGTSADGTNVHGSGCLRSDPKSGNPSDYAGGRGPQGDEVRIYNYVRCVRDADGSGGGGDDGGGDSGQGAGDVDLAIGGLQLGEKNVEAGEKVLVKTKIKNRGDDQSARTTLSYYLSDSRNLDGTALLLGTAKLNSIGSGGVLWRNKRVKLPADTDPDKYFLHVVADEGNLNEEERTNNNSRRRKLTVS